MHISSVRAHHNFAGNVAIKLCIIYSTKRRIFFSFIFNYVVCKTTSFVNVFYECRFYIKSCHLFLFIHFFVANMCSTGIERKL